MSLYSQPENSLYHPPHRQNRPILRIADLNTGSLGAGVDDHPAADIHPHMTFIADNIAGLGLRVGDARPRFSKLPGGPRHSVTIVRIQPEDKAGTVRPVCQARAAGHVRVPDKLAGIVCDGLAAAAAAGLRYDSLGRRDRVRRIGIRRGVLCATAILCG